MTRRTLESKNICYVFKKSVIFGKITILFKKNCKKADYFFCDFKIFDGTIGCAAKFHANEIYIYFFLSLLDQKL